METLYVHMSLQLKRAVKELVISFVDREYGGTPHRHSAPVATFVNEFGRSLGLVAGEVAAQAFVEVVLGRLVRLHAQIDGAAVHSPTDLDLQARPSGRWAGLRSLEQTLQSLLVVCGNRRSGPAEAAQTL